ncbi:hypothetical protein BJF78_22435 [Pseudonocardia sp. CNS-139]|nr:hypothetical protein BJF78_22435 [Pseudonocardia sp. CNS-139]
MTSGMADGAALDLDELIHPRVEPEIASVLGEPVEGPGVTVADVLAATRYVCPALDVIDSRYEASPSPISTRSPTTPPRPRSRWGPTTPRLRAISR